MTAMSEWLALKENLKKWGEEWDAGIVQIRLADGRLMYLDDAVPDTRGDCPTQKPCPHVRCRYHLWRVDDSDRAGRPGLASVPRNELGLTLRVVGKLGGERAGTTLNARWLETPVPQSCALDVAAQGACTNEEIGEHMGGHRTGHARKVKKGLAKAVRVAGQMGMSESELMRGLEELRRQSGRT